METSIESRIEDMEASRSRLVVARKDLESKIAEVQERKQRRLSNNQEK